jgi:dolichol-phosphate mannosyltransferase
MKLSIVIPAYNEALNISETVNSFYQKLNTEQIDHEINVVNDHSRDNTLEVLDCLSREIPTLRILSNEGDPGFGNTVKWGLDRFTGDCVAIVMADLSDSPQDLINFYRELLKGNDCVFGTRWSMGGKAYDYPRHKLFLNRFFNNVVRMLFGIRYDDCTNAFKLYTREAICGTRPFLSPHFNLTLEIPLKAIVRGYKYVVVPNQWRNRKFGKSNLKIKEMGSRYAFILIYCLIEKYFVKNDYIKKSIGQ